MDNKELQKIIKNKRIAAIDFGLKRIGYAVCEEMHIVVSPRDCFQNEGNKTINLIAESLKNDKIDFLLIGLPLSFNNEKNNTKEHIIKFADKLKKIIEIPIEFRDEAFTSKKAVQTMVEIGKKKADRRKKENTDMIAAAIILREFLNDVEGYN